MRLVALKIGDGVPSGPFQGVVHSVFTKAAILRIDDRLATIAPAAAGGLPGAITVDVPPGFDFGAFLELGATAAARAGVLRFSDGAMAIDLRDAVPWRSRLRGLAVECASPSTQSAWRNVADVLTANGGSAAIATLGRPHILGLCEAARRSDPQGAERAASGLVGLGAGGTPAGDDLIVGFLAGLWSSVSHVRARINFCEGFAAIVRRLAGKTNDVSRVYLEAAANCEVSERLSAVIGRVAAGAPEADVILAAKAAAAVGHTSGADGVLGLLLGLAAWAPEPIFWQSRRLVEEARISARALR